ncbi:Periplasmic serine endoprotease DegP precursor [Roseimaritima multifibrata]|uniref:Periplasmic serine endoprotease DegP n=1 Tax=Roseimaritima multifibrata TaxID=1930274 RepID=A0A517MCE3_9BACT|nr:Do family serine endopeptidase [Roseimaritima multifibrata]QDS92562.1 Periplasmic serine endoprotease DegP precursor [Roseimaritima multifibrata]
MQNIWKTLSLTLAAMLLGCLLTSVVLSLPATLQNDAIAQAPTAALSRLNNSTALDLSESFRNVADAMRPTVVSIHTHATEQVRGGNVPPGFEDFFGQLPPRSREREGLGSGVIVRTDGYILTNNHVVEGTDELEVELSDGRRLAAKIMGTDPETDLAVIKIEGTNYAAARLGDSEAIRVGDWVLAIGSPFGLEQTVTAGIISAKNRVQGIVGSGQGIEDFLQTDAAINPGNSGGPLVNLQGEVIGINTAIESRSGGSNGIGFAIPSGMASMVVTSIIESGAVQRGFLGAQVGDLNEQLAKEFGIQSSTGALVISVLNDQPAALGGLQPGDVVTSINGKRMSSGTAVRNHVASQRPGSVLKMQITRNGQPLQLNVTLGTRSRQAMAMFKPGDAGIGAILRPIDPQLAQQLGYTNLDTGLVVTRVEKGSLAARSGLSIGDVIVAVNGRPADTVQVLREAIEQTRAKEQASRIVFLSGNARREIIIQP